MTIPIQKVSGQKAVEKIRSAYRDRTDYSLIEMCRNEVDDALGEVRDKESVIDRLAKAKPMHRNDKSREKSAEQDL